MSTTPSAAASFPRYRTPAIVLHWVIFLLVALAYAMVEFKGYFPKGSASRAAMMTIHEWAGVCVLVLAILRVLWRWGNGVPPAESGQPAWMRVLSSLVHGLLYLFIFAQPILGLLMLNAGGHTLAIPGLDASLPSLIGADKALRTDLKTVHEWLGNAFYAVIGLHALAALWHHYVLKDNTLRRML